MTLTNLKTAISKIFSYSISLNFSNRLSKKKIIKEQNKEVLLEYLLLLHCLVRQKKTSSFVASYDNRTTCTIVSYFSTCTKLFFPFLNAFNEACFLRFDSFGAVLSNSFFLNFGGLPC